MWILTFIVNDPYQNGDYFQECWFGAKPDVTYLSHYIKHFGLTNLTDSWEIRTLAQMLHEGRLVKMARGRHYRLWEKEPVGVIPTY